ncbi:unnamed protein product [Prorocentrum cordatum]|uniref:EF-hand domain-containing protein n=1 Tax=Prorocentrum cordatum TaxID=2364126 RepID=A0ABN9XM21_9DINO|nr:unnamed protein product [Polarella glacialis]
MTSLDAGPGAALSPLPPLRPTGLGSVRAQSSWDPAAWLRGALAAERKVLADVLWERHSAMQAELECRLGARAGRARSPAEAGGPAGSGPPLPAGEARGGSEGLLLAPAAGLDTEAPPSPSELAPAGHARRKIRHRSKILSVALGDEELFPGMASPSSSHRLCPPEGVVKDDQAGTQSTMVGPVRLQDCDEGGPCEEDLRWPPPSGAVENEAVCPRVPPPLQERGRSKDVAGELAGVTASGVFGGESTSRKKCLMEGSSELLYQLVTNAKFELFFSTMILLNAVVVAFAVQFRGFDVGFELGYRWYERPAVETWPMAESSFEVCDWVFGIAFTVELVLKALGMRQYPRAYLTDLWNYFDFAMVVLFYIDALGVTPVKARVLRVIRMVRFARLVKLLRATDGFEALYLMVTAMKGSLGALASSCVILVLLQMLVAFLINQVLYTFYFDNESYDLDERQEVFAYFGTFSRSMLSMFEMTLANWPPICRLLQESVNEWFILFCVVHKLTIGFAVIGVINGVLVQETFKVASTDDHLMIFQRERAVRLHKQKMLRLFRAADDTGDGLLDIKEFSSAMGDRDVQMWMASMELDVSDAPRVFSLVDKDGDGVLTPEELARGVASLKGAARSIDLQILRKELESLRTFIPMVLRLRGGPASARRRARADQRAQRRQYHSSIASGGLSGGLGAVVGRRRRRPSTGNTLFGTPAAGMAPKLGQRSAGKFLDAQAAPRAPTARRWSLPQMPRFSAIRRG